ncbi:MAG: CGLD27 family protein [Cyanothece sp. SIO1E1]|nr:CGLD27 family protein [Cyanothece sp. SIO1E1]
MIKSSSPACPVPFEQQPINEYQDLKESWFYSWASRNLRGYLIPIVVLCGFGWLLSGPVTAASFAPTRHPVQFFIAGLAGAGIVPALALVQLHLGWLYVRDRLLKPTVIYEESGWYDGQSWTKPEAVLVRDRLIATHEIQPIFERLKRTCGVLLGIYFILAVMAWITL